MIRLAFLILSFSLYSQLLLAFGATGHRIIGEIAQQHLSRKAQKKASKLLGNESMAIASNFMDHIKSDPHYDSLKPWHYCTIPDTAIYDQAPPEGDVIKGILFFKAQLESVTTSKEEKSFALKCLIHLVGDIHQPLHVGNGEDRGGNDIKVNFFWDKSNLHRVWDSGIIDQQQLSYSEYSQWINHATKEQIKLWSSSSIYDWAKESQAYRPMIYQIPEGGNIDYQYTYQHLPFLNQRLLQAGIRLAALLNSLFR